MKTSKREKTFDTRDISAYALAEAARYVKLPAATLRSWVAGRYYPKAKGVGQFSPLIKPSQRDPLFLSFWNLIEAHVLRSLRTEHGVALTEVRKALKYAEGKLKIERLLLSKQLSTDAGQMFLHHYGELINLSASGQLAMRRLFDEHLKRVEWDEWQFPVPLYPFLMSDVENAVKPIMIDPAIAFGRPVIARMGISTRAIAERIDAGETVKDLASDYDLEPSEIEQAVLYERAALNLVFFTDRDLGKRFPEILASAGLNVERHPDFFPPRALDEQWLQYVGENGRIAVTHDTRTNPTSSPPSCGIA